VNETHILSWILFTPLIGAMVLLFMPREWDNAQRVIGNVFGMLGFVVSLPLIWRFQIGTPGYQFRENHDWIPSIGAHYSLGIDGISFLLVMLTTILGAISILSSWSAIQTRKKEYYILFLLLQTGMLGVFMSLDFFLFYLFWEVMLVPMYFLIGVWGSDRRLYAAAYAQPGGMKAGFEVFRAFEQDAKDFGWRQMAREPTKWPWRSLIPLSPSRSNNRIAKERPVRRERWISESITFISVR